jgi:hypothetical protein
MQNTHKNSPITAIQLVPKSSNSGKSRSSKADAIHRSLCILCQMDAAQPGFEAEVKEFYMRFHGAEDISEMIGEVEITKSVPVKQRGRPKKKVKKGDDTVETPQMKFEKIKVRKCPERTIRRHAQFYGWDKERANDLSRVLDVVIDGGVNSIQFTGVVDQKTLMLALDMRNKMEGNYFKPGKNPKDLREQMKATVESIYRQHQLSGQTDVTHDAIIDKLSTRPGFQHIKAVLRNEHWNED